MVKLIQMYQEVILEIEWICQDTKLFSQQESEDEIYDSTIGKSLRS